MSVLFLFYYLLGSGIVDILKKPRLAKTTPSFINKVATVYKAIFGKIFLILQSCLIMKCK